MSLMRFCDISSAVAEAQNAHGTSVKTSLNCSLTRSIEAMNKVSKQVFKCRRYPRFSCLEWLSRVTKRINDMISGNDRCCHNKHLQIFWTLQLAHRSTAESF